MLMHKPGRKEIPVQKGKPRRPVALFIRRRLKSLEKRELMPGKHSGL